MGNDLSLTQFIALRKAGNIKIGIKDGDLTIHGMEWNYCQQHPLYFTNSYFPNFNPNETQKLIIKNSVESGNYAGYCNRRTGKSTTLELVALHSALFNENFHILYMIPKWVDIALKARKIMHLCNTLPRFIRRVTSNKNQMVNSTASGCIFKNGSSIEFIDPFSRFDHADLIILDEFEFMNWNTHNINNIASINKIIGLSSRNDIADSNIMKIPSIKIFNCN